MKIPIRTSRLTRPKGRTAGRSVFQRLRRNRSFALRMAPMIDVVFLLLLFFLVAAKWRPAENFLPFQSPAAHAAQPSPGKAEPLIIEIYSTPSGCKVSLGALNVFDIRQESINADLAGLMEGVIRCLENEKRLPTDPVEIYCGPEVKADYWVKIYNILYGMQLRDITFVMTEVNSDDDSN